MREAISSMLSSFNQLAKAQHGAALACRLYLLLYASL